MRLRGNVDVPPADPLMQQVGGLLQNAAAAEVRGAEALGKRQWTEAIASLRKAIELAPDNAFTRLNLGTALYQTGDAAGALEQFKTAVRLSPGLAKAHYGIGIVTEAAGRDREAIDAFSAAVKNDPAYVEARLSLADALRRSGRMAESLPHYAEVIRVSPAVSQARFGYAMALVRLKRYQEARDRLADDLKTYPDQPGFAHALARLLAAAPDDRVRDGRRAMTLMQELLKTQRTIEMASNDGDDAGGARTIRGRRELAARRNASRDASRTSGPCCEDGRESQTLRKPHALPHAVARRRPGVSPAARELAPRGVNRIIE